MASGKKMTKELFIEKAMRIHGDSYNYDNVDFVNYTTEVEIFCPKEHHGIFRLKPRSHICDKTKCPKCTKPGRTNYNWFIENAKIIHGDLYDYSRVNYVSAMKHVEIICKVDDHGMFKQTPNSHINNKNKCPKCFGLFKKPVSKFIDEANKTHNHRFIYDKVNYVDNKTKIEILCEFHGSFWQTPKHHIRGSGCSKCSGKYPGNTEFFIQRANIIHNFYYDYSNVEYTKNSEKINIICKIHGCFKQTPHDHLDGHGCPSCSHTISKKEKAWLDFLAVPNNFRNKTLKINGKLFKPDAIDDCNKIIWEFYGDYFHGNPSEYDPNDINLVNGKTFGELYENTIKKEYFLKEAGYKVISIWESDWK